MKWKFLNTIDMLGEKNCLKRKSFSLLRFPFSKKKSKEKGIGGNGKSFKGENKRKKKRPIFRFHQDLYVINPSGSRDGVSDEFFSSSPS